MILCHNDYFEKLVIYIWMAPQQKYEILHVENITQKRERRISLRHISTKGEKNIISVTNRNR